MSCKLAAMGSLGVVT